MTIEEFIARNDGVVSSDMLRTHGLSPEVAARAVRSGGLVRVSRGWFALPGAPHQFVQAVSAGGRLSCVSVLRQYGVWSVNDRRPHVRTGRHSGHSPGMRDAARVGLVVHRAHVDEPLGAAATDGFEVALRHAVRCQPALDATASLDSALNIGILSVAEIAGALDPLPARCRRLLDLVDGRCQSGLETKARLGLRALNVPHRLQVPIEGVGHVDELIGDRLVLELDGWEWHSKKRDFEKDRRRDLVLARLGYLVIRVSYHQVSFEWHAVIATIRGVVARAEHRWAPRHGGRQG
jgi:very-short-patch-repair endonuclease